MWSAEVHRGKLYMGTYDWSVVAAETGVPGGAAAARANSFGADLWRFDDTASPAVAECTDGCGNGGNYGIRNMISDGTTLFVGTANPVRARLPAACALLRRALTMMRPVRARR